MVHRCHGSMRFWNNNNIQQIYYAQFLYIYIQHTSFHLFTFYLYLHLHF